MYTEEEQDIFQDSSPQIVDCDVLEAAKENIQPLGTGRRVTALSAILSTPHAQREAKLSATRNRLRINVELALDDEEDGDPLEAYCRLVNWTVENYPQGHSAESGLLELLEEATRVLKDNREGRWRADLKYLKLWLLYASYVEKPTVIYKFLIANDIGSGHALLYEEYAAVLERDGRRKEADDAYALGIARRASPLDHLENRYTDFQKRMMSNMLSPQATPAPPAQAPRAALAVTASGPSSSRAASSRLPASSSSQSSNSRLQIFVDPSGSESLSADAQAASNTWTDLGTRKTRIKENVPETKKLVGSTIRQAGKTKRIASSSGSSGAGASKIAIYRDPEPGEMPPPSVPVPAKKMKDAVPKTPAKGGFAIFVDEGEKEAAPTATPKFTPFRDEASSIASPRVGPTASEPIIRVIKDGARAPQPTTEAEALRKDPLKNYGPGATAQDG